jgi:hypothetical protein
MSTRTVDQHLNQNLPCGVAKRAYGRKSKKWRADKDGKVDVVYPREWPLSPISARTANEGDGFQRPNSPIGHDLQSVAILSKSERIKSERAAKA